MTGLSTTILVGLVLIVLMAPRRWALLGMIAGLLYLTQGNYIQVLGLTIFPSRILAVAALVRVAYRRELRHIELGRLDVVVSALYVFVFAVYALRTDVLEGYYVGLAIDAVVSYFAFRGLVQRFDDYGWFLRMTAMLLVPYAILVCIETYTSANPFVAVGGVELSHSGSKWFREGRLRATGSFGHPSLLGTCAATFVALYVGVLASGKERLIAAVGLAACLVIIWATNSGGPVTCLAVAAAGWILWLVRRDMRIVRGALAVLLIALILVMKAPVWYVLARLSDVTGGDGFHRARLLDVAFQNLDKWWLAGMPILQTRGWMPYVNATTGGTDITNHFLQFGLIAGLGALALAVAIFVLAFSQLGRAMAHARAFQGSQSRSFELTLWSLGVVLAIHAVNWFGISYWDQTNMLWFMHLAMIGSLTTRRATSAQRASPGVAEVNTPTIASRSLPTKLRQPWQHVARRNR